MTKQELLDGLVKKTEAIRMACCTLLERVASADGASLRDMGCAADGPDLGQQLSAQFKEWQMLQELQQLAVQLYPNDDTFQTAQHLAAIGQPASTPQ